MADTKIKLLYTPDEWKILEDACHDQHDSNLREYLHSRMHVMAKNCATIPKKEGDDKLPVNFIIPEDICGQLSRFARHRNISLSKLICWYNIDPLLKQHYEDQFKRRP